MSGQFCLGLLTWNTENYREAKIELKGNHLFGHVQRSIEFLFSTACIKSVGNTWSPLTIMCNNGIFQQRRSASLAFTLLCGVVAM